jgi:nuclear pore complex protein Nup205
MPELGALERLESLHRDLLSLSQLRLSNVERLWVQLEAHIGEFRHMLEKAPRNEQSRKSLTTGTCMPGGIYMSWELTGSDLGKLPVQDDEYAINEDFQQTALQLADALDLDELESARIVLEALADAEVLGRSLLESSIIRYHQTRKYLLDSFRLVLHGSVDPNTRKHIRDTLQDVVSRVIQPQQLSGDRPSFITKCLQNMEEMKAVLQSLIDRLNGASVLGQVQRSELLETIEYQRASLVQQHESLGTIVHFLVKANYAAPKDFEQILDVLKRADKYDNLLGTFLSSLAIGARVVVTLENVWINHCGSTPLPGGFIFYICVWRSGRVFINSERSSQLE